MSYARQLLDAYPDTLTAGTRGIRATAGRDSTAATAGHIPSG